MSAPLLNVSSATTAFYEDMMVDDFFKEFRPLSKESKLV